MGHSISQTYKILATQNILFVDPKRKWSLGSVLIVSFPLECPVMGILAVVWMSHSIIRTNGDTIEQIG